MGIVKPAYFKWIQKPVLLGIGRKCLALQLIFAMGFAGAQSPLPKAPASEVVVEGNTAALQNLGRAVQSQEAQSPFLPNKNTVRTQPNLVLPDMGDPGGDALSPVDERRIGERIMREIRADPDYSNDLPIYDFLNQMDRRLLQAAKRLQLGGANTLGSAQYNFEVFAVKEPSINAFALPGGFIGFHTGLLVAAETESEVASVMGHEIGHILQRHIARSMDKQAMNTMIAIAGMVLGALAASSNPSAAIGLMRGGQALSVQNQLAYSRDAEREADRIGFLILEGSGYDVNGMPAFFQRLQKATSIMDSGVPAYVRTHPLTIDRIADMQDRVRMVNAKTVPSSLEFYLIKARARLDQQKGSSGLFDARNIFESFSKQASPIKQMEGLYGLALVAQRQGKLDIAEGYLQKTRQMMQAAAAPGSPIVRQSVSLDTTASELALAKGKSQEALQIAHATLRAYPESFAAAVAMIQAELKLGKTDEAISWLRSRTKQQPNETIWWTLLADAYNQSNNVALRHYAMGEKFALTGAWPSAIEQMRIARAAGGNNYYQGSTIDARLREFQKMYQEEQRDDAKNRGG
jgi:predicted Zn-dependent protease